MKNISPIIVILLVAALTVSRAQNTWTQEANFGGTARGSAAGFSIGDKGYIGTGNSLSGLKKDFWEYDPGTNSWTQKADFGGNVRRDAVGFSIGNKGYMGTGLSFAGPYLKDFWEYDPVTNNWIQKANFGGAGRYLAVGFSIGSKGYIGTGANFFIWPYYKYDFWEYDPVTDTWTQKANFGGTGRYSATGFAIGSKGYIGTGYNADDGNKNDFWEYDPAIDSWTRKADFDGTARRSAAGFSIGSKGYMGTGYDGANFTNDFWAFDPATNSWMQEANFGGTARWKSVGFSIGGNGYIGTGESYTNDLWKYAPECSGLTIYADADGDGYGDVTNSYFASDCVLPDGYVTDNSDCNDANAAIHPGAADVCNGVDDNCNGVIDENAITAATTDPSGAVSFCQGTTLTITANNGAGISYQWYKNNTPISGATNQIYSPKKLANYYVKESNTFGCTATSAIVSVTVLNPPAASINPLGDLDICVAGSVNLQANPCTGYSYQWKKGTNNITGATNQIYTATAKGNYKVTVTGSNGCSKTSNVLGVTKSCRETFATEAGISSTLSFYPNPSNGQFSIDLKSGNAQSSSAIMEIINSLNQIVYEENVLITNGELKKEIDCIRILSDGMFWVKVIAADKIYSGSIMIQK